MKVELKETPIQTIVQYSDHLKKCQGYKDNDDGGVYGMGGRLNIRPKFQREFIYKAPQRDAVIDSVRQELPLNSIYWGINRDGSYDVIDGQQRLISICQYVSSVFSIKDEYFHNLTKDQQQQILDYKLMVYLCDGTDSERLDYFRKINLQGEELTPQELRNAVYTGTWLSNAKDYFSKPKGLAYNLASRYVDGSPIRQIYLETVLKWINNGKIDAYMAEHQHDTDAKELWNYFESVIKWVERIFTTYRSEMKGLEWGFLYNKYKDIDVDPAAIEKEVHRLMEDEDVGKKNGIYLYLLTGDEKRLRLRGFSLKTKREVYERQRGVCPICKGEFSFGAMEGDHILPWCKGGKTTPENCQMLCIRCNRTKR